MTVTVHATEGSINISRGVSESAMKRARVSFNPSGNERVTFIKMLTAALYSELEAIAAEGAPGPDNVKGREAATAATQLQLAAMMAVSAATAE